MMSKIFIALLLISSIMCAQSKEKSQFELKQYFFVLLKKGQNRDQDSIKTAEIQKGHMNNINKLAEQKKLVLAGPFGDESGGGIFILNTESLENAKLLCDADPAVAAGRLIYEIRPWWTDKNSFTAEMEKDDEQK